MLTKELADKIIAEASSEPIASIGDQIKKLNAIGELLWEYLETSDMVIFLNDFDSMESALAIKFGSNEWARELYRINQKVYLNADNLMARAYHERKIFILSDWVGKLYECEASVNLEFDSKLEFKAISTYPTRHTQHKPSAKLPEVGWGVMILIRHTDQVIGQFQINFSEQHQFQLPEAAAYQWMMDQLSALLA